MGKWIIFGRWLSQQLDALGKSPANFAADIRVSRSTVSKMLSGSLLPSESLVRRMAASLYLEPMSIQFHIGQSRQDVMYEVDPEHSSLSFEACVNQAHALLDGPPSRPDLAYSYITAAEKKTRNDEEWVEARLLRSRYYTDLSRHDLAWEVADEAVNTRGISPQSLSRLEIAKGLADLNRGAPRDALKSALSVRELGPAHAHPKALVFAANLEGRAREAIEDYEDAKCHPIAIRCHQEAAKLAGTMDPPRVDLVKLSNAYEARVHGAAGQSDLALEMFEDVVAWAREHDDWQTKGESLAYRVEVIIRCSDLPAEMNRVNDDLDELALTGKAHDDPRLIAMAGHLRLEAYARLSEMIGLVVRRETVHQVRKSVESAVQRLHPRNPIRGRFQRVFSNLMGTVSLVIVLSTPCWSPDQNRLERPSEHTVSGTATEGIRGLRFEDILDRSVSGLRSRDDLNVMPRTGRERPAEKSCISSPGQSHVATGQNGVIAEKSCKSALVQPTA